jgi:hypothetical protein
MDIVNEFYPEYEHHFFYDNATTHLKRPSTALSACCMQRIPPNLERTGKSKLPSMI